MSALHLAAHCGYWIRLEFLIKAGANFNAQNGIGFTTSHWAEARNNIASALPLLEKGADVNIPDFKRRTPLYSSVLNNNVMCIIHCVKFGADKGPENIIALSKAIELG
jgi:ankyrin repeat protein